MRPMFANFLAAPFLLGAILFLYLSWSHDSDFALWIIPCVVLTAVVYIFAPQINWWWYTRHPQDLPEGLTRLLERFSTFYQRLPAAEKKRFRERITLFDMATDWAPTGWPDDALPPDVRMVLAAQAVTITFRRSEFLFEKFEKVVIYPYPFPSPEYDFLHASELYEPDGCLLFSAEQLMKAFIEPARCYNIGLHEYARAFALTYPNEAYPTFDDTAWPHLEQVSGMTRAHVESVVGLTGVEALPVAVHHYYLFPEAFRAALPEAAAAFDRIFAPEKT